ncbi:TRADD-N-associated membrane domain-containing protein [Pseudovibrio ascidiaceicola]|uniref:TRADD-N-associated membrane domain-containing protein n=1 Tax=Pseudovibrio ascidiaceicola TaxID=285279 RepID=UPI000D691480|nr:hypothetical protein [Pseudovibrio ascidiaceicola]
MNDILFVLLDLYWGFLRRHTKTQARIVGVLMVLSGSLILSLSLTSAGYFREEYNSLQLVALLTILSLMLITLVSFSNFSFSAGFAVIEKLAEQKDKLRERVSDASKVNDKGQTIIDTAQLNTLQIAEYYEINKRQAKSSYANSVTCAGIGLAIVIWAILYFLHGNNPNITLASVSGVSGLILQIVGGLQLYIYGKTMQEFRYLHDQLLKVQDTLLAVHLVEGMEGQAKDEAKKKMVDDLIWRSKPKV